MANALEVADSDIQLRRLCQTARFAVDREQNVADLKMRDVIMRRKISQVAEVGLELANQIQSFLSFADNLESKSLEYQEHLKVLEEWTSVMSTVCVGELKLQNMNDIKAAMSRKHQDEVGQLREHVRNLWLS